MNFFGMSMPSLEATLGTIITIIFVFVIGFVIYQKKIYKYDICIREERHGNTHIVIMDKGCIEVREGIKKLYIKGYNLYWQPPTLDCIESQANGKPLINLWRDIHGNFHQMRATKFVPIITTDKHGNVVQLEEEEILFLPDNKGSSFWALQEKKSIFQRHMNKDWWSKNGGMVVIGAIITVGIIALLLTGYYISQMTAKNVAATSSLAESAKTMWGLTK